MKSKHYTILGLLSSALIFFFASHLSAKNNSEEKSKGYKALKAESVHSQKNVHKRTKPVARVYTSNDDVPAAPPPPEVKHDGPRSGKKVYDTYCTACHSTTALGAPVKGTDVWKDLLKNKGGIDGLVTSAIKGVPPNMPPKGTCMDCSDEELKTAIQFMIDGK